MKNENLLDLEYTETYDHRYWTYNVPLQMWPFHDSKEESDLIGWQVLNYMPRKDKCCALDEIITIKEMPAYCRNAAKILRNLADRFDKMAKNEIDTIYYPNETNVHTKLKSFKKELDKA